MEMWTLMEQLERCAKILFSSQDSTPPIQVRETEDTRSFISRSEIGYVKLFIFIGMSVSHCHSQLVTSVFMTSVKLVIVYIMVG